MTIFGVNVGISFGVEVIVYVHSTFPTNFSLTMTFRPMLIIIIKIKIIY